MGNIEDFRARQQELARTQEELRSIEEKLKNQKNELDIAKIENEDKKSELIEQLLSQIDSLKGDIDALRGNNENYEQQIKSINEELKALQERFAVTQQTTAEQTTAPQTTAEQTTVQETTEQQTTSQQTVTEQPAAQETATEQAAAQQTVTEQPATQQTTAEQESSTEQTTTEQPATQQITTEEIKESTEQTANQVDIHTYDGFLLVLDKLLEEIKDTKKGISKRGLSKAGKKTMNEAKTKLKQYEDVLKDKKRTLLKQKNAEIYENDISNLKNLWEQVNNVRRDIGMGQWGEFSSTASYLYNSPENAKKSNKHQAENLRFNQNFQEELKPGAILNIFGNNVQAATDFYRRIAEGKYTQADYYTYVTNSSLLNPSFQRCGIAIPTDPSLAQLNGGRIATVQGSPRTSVDFSNMSLGEAFQQGGIVGMIDKGLGLCKNMTPGQRNAWRGVALLGGVAAGIFGLYKFFTNKKMGFWGKALTTGGVIFASQALTGENPIALFQKLLTGGFTNEYLQDKFGNLFGEAVSGLGDSGIESSSTIAPAMYSMMIFNSSTTVGNIREQTNRFKADENEWKNFRSAAISKLKSKYGENSVQHFSATFSDNFEEEKWNNRLASLGVTDGTDNNKLIYELANNATMNEVIIEKFRTEHGVKETSNEVKRKEFREYVDNLKKTNQAIDIKQLENHPDWFELDKNATYTERPEDIQNKETLSSKVEALGIDAQKKSELKTAIQRFYDERTIESKPNLNDFSLESENDLLILTSHNGQKTKIDINKNEIIGFGNGIKFTNLYDILNVADISNKILLTQKGKTPKDLPAFEYKVGKMGRGIYFNDKDFSDYLSFDTRVLSGGWGGKMGEIKTLGDHPEEYATYLSNRWIESNKINIDANQYPTVKKLSDSGITFTNEQEVKDLEDWLKSIKEGKKFSVGTPNGNPFRLSWRFTSLSNKLVFTAVNGDDEIFQEDIAEKFPTLMRKENQDKFIRFMNNPSNGMRGSAIN